MPKENFDIELKKKREEQFGFDWDKELLIYKYLNAKMTEKEVGKLDVAYKFGTYSEWKEYVINRYRGESKIHLLDFRAYLKVKAGCRGNMNHLWMDVFLPWILSMAVFPVASMVNDWMKNGQTVDNRGLMIFASAVIPAIVFVLSTGFALSRLINEIVSTSVENELERAFFENYIDLIDQILAGMDTQDENVRKRSDQQTPGTLFKYRSGTKEDLDALRMRYIWAADVETMNDPFEGVMNLSVECTYNIKITDEQCRKIIDLLEQEDSWDALVRKYGREKAQEQVQKKYQMAMSKLRKKYIVAALSEKKDSILMWSHYANKHQGYCVEYPTDGFEDPLHPVKYQDEILDVMDDLKDLPLIKSKQWQYEAEWRLAKIVNNDSIDPVEKQELQKMKTPKPVAIYLGCCFDFTSTMWSEILVFSVENDIPLYQMKGKQFAYGLTEVSVDTR